MSEAPLCRIGLLNWSFSS